MASKLGIAFGASLIGTALVIACGGANAPDVLGAPDPTESSTSSSGASGVGTTSGTGTTSGVGTSNGQSTSSTSSGTTGSTTSTSSSSTGGPDPCGACAPPPPGCVANTPAPGKCDCSYRCPDAGGGVKCTWSKDANVCPTGYYCEAQNCGSGFCVAKATTETKERNPQCGCDGVTYWNSSVSLKAGMPLRNAGACIDTAQKCGGLTTIACGAGVSCNHPVKNKAACSLVDGAGTCWKMPAECPSGANARSRSCSTATCIDECKAVLSQGQWYEDGSCP